MLAALLAALPGPGMAAPAASKETRPVTKDVYAFQVQTADGKQRSLADFRGKALLIVNTASKCGLTPQYEGLEKLYERYKDRGLMIVGFPANDFLWQEPGTDAEIQTFCSVNYGVTFPVFAKISVKGKHIAPLYQYLTKESPFPGDIGWNFAKFLVAPDGRVVARFDPKVDPLDKKVTAEIEAVLPAK
jgi:glutathione peroxidase